MITDFISRYLLFLNKLHGNTFKEAFLLVESILVNTVEKINVFYEKSG